MGIDLLRNIPGKEFPSQFDPKIYKDKSKHDHDPFETLNQGAGYKNEQEPHNDGTEDPPKQYPMVIALLDIEGQKDHDDHEDIIHRERIFNKIPGQVFERKIMVVIPDRMFKIGIHDVDWMMIPVDKTLNIRFIPDTMQFVSEETEQDIKQDSKANPENSPQ